MQVVASSIIYPTEDAKRVEAALGNLFFLDSMVVETEGRQIRTLSTNRDSLDHIRNKILSLRIIDAIRSRLLSNWNGEETTLWFDKQAAHHGKLRLIDDMQEEPPLGPVELTLGFASEQEFEAFLAWFAPPTKDGHVISH